MRILFTGGGTGGHIFPVVAIKRAFVRFDSARRGKRKEIKFLYVGPNGFSKGVFKKEDIKCKFVLAGKLRRYFSLANFADLLKIPIGLIQSLWHVFWFMPDVIFSKGGYGSISVVFTGWLYRIPVIIHESDSVPGLANKILTPFAKKIIISFEEAKKYFPPKKTILLGNPIREELTQGSKETGRTLFGLSSEKPIVLIMGGSQGAQKINEIILNTLPRLLEKCEIIHLCGTKNLKHVETSSAKILEKFDSAKKGLYHLYPFLEEEKLKHAYAVSDIIISRAGAGGVFEAAAIGKPSVLIPLSIAASDHQTKNAWALAKIGGAIDLKEKNLTINMFLSAVFGLINNPARAKEMREKAKSFYKPETNQKIMEEILKLC
jgi:UDP-N-acetylglucosamine--N-acetylmuramyl-(pentapeptide) pyrophosphoryl-undecaprenol N-acetylglucosamine transferase